MKRSAILFACILFFRAAAAFPAQPPAAPPPGAKYPEVTGPCNFVFPRDHGAHPGYRAEWWYYTGNLRAAGGARYGFQLTFFRTRINPPGGKTMPPDKSAWRTDQIYVAHAALSSIDQKRFYQAEKMARGALGLAGARQQGADVRIFLESWSVLLAPGRHRLRAAAGRFGLDLVCTPAKPPVAHGDRGYSRKGAKPYSASCYYSFTRLETSGELRIDGARVSVQGTAWMDHEFSSAPLEANLTGWDWFGLQFADGTELMLYLLRTEGNGRSGASSGTFIDRSGKSRHLGKADFQVDVLDHWQSGRSGARYPSRWRIRVLPLALDLKVVPNMAAQELVTPRTTQVAYWEGSVSVKGRKGEKPIAGQGYAEMTGYAAPFRLLENGAGGK